MDRRRSRNEEAQCDTDGGAETHGGEDIRQEGQGRFAQREPEGEQSINRGGDGSGACTGQKRAVGPGPAVAIVRATLPILRTRTPWACVLAQAQRSDPRFPTTTGIWEV